MTWVEWLGWICVAYCAVRLADVGSWFGRRWVARRRAAKIHKAQQAWAKQQPEKQERDREWELNRKALGALVREISEEPQPPIDWEKAERELTERLRTEGIIGAEGRPAPHCDSFVLHGPSQCRYCDEYPAHQQARIDQNINFTGEHDPKKTLCPSELYRPIDVINRWSGNRPRPKHEITPEWSVTLNRTKP